jgi:hypothetical protein
MVNKVRGEVAVSFGDHDLVLCAEMGRMAEVSAQLGTIGMMEIARRVQIFEPAAVLACLLHLDITDTFKGIESPNISLAIPIIDKIVIALAGGEDLTETRSKKTNAATTTTKN